jgi:hypothetical protein
LRILVYNSRKIHGGELKEIPVNLSCDSNGYLVIGQNQVPGISSRDAIIILSGCPKELNYPTDGLATFGDIDGDGIMEISGGRYVPEENRTYLYLWQT